MYKIFELIFDDTDDEQGLDKISLVANPATEISWQVFNNDHDFTCSTNDIDFTEKGLNIISSFGVRPNPISFFNAKFSDVEIKTNSHQFWYVSPNPREFDPLSGDQEEGNTIQRYIYVVDTGVGAPLMPYKSKKKPGSRDVCRRMIREGKVYSREDLKKMSVSLTSQGDTFQLIPRARNNSQVDFFEFGETEMKGGNRCRHKWRQVNFIVKTNETMEQALSRVPLRAAQVSQAGGQFLDGAGRPFQSEAKYLNRMPVGFSTEKTNEPIGFFMGLFFYQTKFAALMAEPSCKLMSKVKMGDMEGWCPVDIHPDYFEGDAEVKDKFRIKQEFSAVPEYMRSAAKRAVDYADENGWGDCGTDVGKRRANDLADPNYNASVDILTRMYSYGSRHKVDYESSKSIDEGCGYLMMLSWGFTPDNYDGAIKWLERQIENSTEMNVSFSKEKYKGDITAVVFQPDQKIYRMGDDGKPYWVFMSRETIRKMLMKVSKQKDKFRDLINYEHSGMVFSGNEIYSYENWLVGENPTTDKSYEIFGREFAPGTWITTLHFNNDRFFEDFVLSNRTTGISLEGIFQEVPFRFMDQVKDEYFAEGMPHYTADGELYTGETHTHNGRLMTGENHTEDSEYLYHETELGFDFPSGTCWEGYEPYGTKILDGKEVPNCVPMKKFNFPDDTCWEGYEPYGTKIVDGREVPNCVPVDMIEEFKAKDTLDKLIEMLKQIDKSK